jgi:hypothetical protein
MDVGVKILFVMIVALEELFFRCSFSLESFDQVILIGLNGDGFSWLDDYGTVSKVIKFLDKRADASVSIIDVCHVLNV